MRRRIEKTDKILHVPIGRCLIICAAKHSRQPRASEFPIPLRRAAGNIQSGRDFLKRHAPEKMQVDNLRRLAIDLGQLLERLINGQHVVRRNLDGQIQIIGGMAVQIAAMLEPALATRAFRRECGALLPPLPQKNVRDLPRAAFVQHLG